MRTRGGEAGFGRGGRKVYRKTDAVGQSNLAID